MADKLSKGQRRRRNRRLRKQDAFEVTNSETIQEKAQELSVSVSGKVEKIIGDDAVDAVITMALKPRHTEILDYMCQALNKDKQTIVCELLRSAIMREATGFREWKSGAAGSVRKQDMDKHFPDQKVPNNG